MYCFCWKDGSDRTLWISNACEIVYDEAGWCRWRRIPEKANTELWLRVVFVKGYFGSVHYSMILAGLSESAYKRQILATRLQLHADMNKRRLIHDMCKTKSDMSKK